MAKVLLILAAIVDIALAALLIGVSGFLFGTGPESTHAGAALMAGYAAAVIACIVAPIAGFVFNRRGNSTPGIIIAWMPPAGALLALAIPAPY